MQSGVGNSIRKYTVKQKVDNGGVSSLLAAISTIRNFLSKFLDGFNELSNWPLNSQFIYFMQCKRHHQRLFSSSKNEVLFRWWKKIIVKLSGFLGPSCGGHYYRVPNENSFRGGKTKSSFMCYFHGQDF